MLKEALAFYLSKYSILSHDMLLAGAFLHPNFKDFKFIKDQTVRKKRLESVIDFLGEKFKNEICSPNVELVEEPQTPGSAASISSLDKFLYSQIDSTPDSGSIIDKELEKEIKAYQDVNFIPKNVMLDGIFCSFWKSNELNFPRLAKIAKIVCSAPATEAPSEREFSSDNNNVWPQRNKLSPETLSVLSLIRGNKNLN